MTDNARQPVFSRPPVDGNDDELDHWAEEFLDAVLGSTSPDEKRLGSPQDKDDLGPLLDPYGGPDEDCGDLYPTPDMIDEAEVFGWTFAGAGKL